MNPSNKDQPSASIPSVSYHPDNARDVPDLTDLESLLLWMAQHGDPHIYRTFGERWRCFIEMKSGTVGLRVTIASDDEFGEAPHATPLSAARQCAERMVVAIKGRE